MSQISVTPETLIQQAKVYTQARDQIEAAKQQVKSMNDQIASEWQGQAFQSYLQQYAQLEKQVNQFEELLTNINQQLNQYAQTVQERDQQDAKSFGF
ncbi:WXG100 family type VII secretion target [Weissella muntiaci]|jgi:WXG100 family type VII secretion target|uniref:ESAT-6-like protein n=1 Tax=Weissella muntiaci TaxID=2508881 RepID=A0A6C2C3B2_9LACO|nr:WXG100 family type VII secretion target [Weissella muntiaci]TYC48229.1 WXG100 family type VII secretion target [Weissella muntiaci]